MAARGGRHQRFFGVDAGGRRQRQRHHMRRPTRHVQAAVELPFVGAAVALAGEILVVALPGDGGEKLLHAGLREAWESLIVVTLLVI